DLELRQRQNAILRQGANTAVEQAVRRAEAAEHIEDARLAKLDPAAASVVDVLHTFTIKARGQVAVEARSAPSFAGEQLVRAADDAMVQYVQRAGDVADHVESVVGTDAGRELRARLENVRFSFGLARSSLQEIALKHEYVARGLLAPVELRGLVNQL